MRLVITARIDPAREGRLLPNPTPPARLMRALPNPRARLTQWNHADEHPRALHARP